MSTLTAEEKPLKRNPETAQTSSGSLHQTAALSGNSQILEIQFPPMAPKSPLKKVKNLTEQTSHGLQTRNRKEHTKDCAAGGTANAE
ncbi:MAG: hypothetical protein KDA89_25655 [Planctomycetaceae bacterium]|nr:hypothetical protein [Planctomycetaceae bacterium]